MQLLIREKPPLRLHHIITTPSGRSYRWGEDEPNPANVPSGLQFSTKAPGGYDTASATLPRKPEVDYADLTRLTNWRIMGAGEVAWEGRLEEAPRVAGEQMAVSPSAVGWQAHLDDNKGASAVYVDRDLASWGSPSVTRLDSLHAANRPMVGSASSTPDETSGIPYLRLRIDGQWESPKTPSAEAWYDAGPANTVSSQDYSFSGTTVDTTFILLAGSAATDDTTPTVTADLFTASTGSGTHTPTTPARYLTWSWYHPTTPGGVEGEEWWCNVATVVWGNTGITQRGSTVKGVFASDVIAHAVRNFAPLLRFTEGTTGTITPTGFVIPHLVFKDFTTSSAIVSGANRYHLNDWFVWHGQRPAEPTFYYHDRGARGKHWRARVGPARLQETGSSITSVWNGVIVRYQDVDGASRTVGPTGSGANTESTDCEDSDPLNPANQRGIRRWDVLEMSGVSTAAGAAEVGRRFLEEAKLLNTSGQATLVGHVEDDHGVLFPAWRVRAGDQITFTDAADRSSRRIVGNNYSHPERTNTVDLDSPADGLAALLERLQVVLVPLGVN